MISCGWCGAITAPLVCSSCGRDPALPWHQRGQIPPTEADVRRVEARRRLNDARRDLGQDATAEQIAEHLDVSPRTVRRWQEMSASRPSTPPDVI